MFEGHDTTASGNWHYALYVPMPGMCVCVCVCVCVCAHV